MRAVSKKRAKRNAEVREWRRALILHVWECEVCGIPPWHVATWGQKLNSGSTFPYSMSVHEIARGPNREKALDKAYAVLVVCDRCHDGPLASRAQWPEARQLAALKRSRPEDYDLTSYNALVGRGPQRVTEEDVAKWR